MSVMFDVCTISINRRDASKAIAYKVDNHSLEELHLVECSVNAN